MSTALCPNFFIQRTLSIPQGFKRFCDRDKGSLTPSGSSGNIKMSQTIGNDCKYENDDDSDKGCGMLDSGEVTVSLKRISSSVQDDDRMTIDCDCDMIFDGKQQDSWLLVVQKNVPMIFF